jgi:signal peptidase I
VVVIASPEHDGSYWARRVIGLPGERIDIRAGGVQADGKLYTWDELTDHSTVTGAVESGPYRVPSDGYFLIGDNMQDSRDSRELGGTLRKEILGVKK